MARALNGLHWQSPLQWMPNRSQTQVNAGAGFGSVLILSHSGTPPTGEPVARDNICWLAAHVILQPVDVVSGHRLTRRWSARVGQDEHRPKPGTCVYLGL